MPAYLINVLCALMLSLSAPSCTETPKPACNCGNTIETPFKTGQKKYERVRQAYLDKEAGVTTLLNSKNICANKLRIFIRAFKIDKQFEVWGKNTTDSTYQLLRTYKICTLSGIEGPKRKRGDGQIPEGFYHIDMFNPTSRFYLSLGLNYPNASDKILGNEDPGDDIFIHGDCVSIGCMPLTDDIIKELYVLCVEATNAGQTNIPVHVFPTRLTVQNLAPLYKKHKGDKALVDFWQTLKPGYDYFEKNKKVPIITVDAAGKYCIN